jgi:phosphatidate cytidylyltransferase
VLRTRLITAALLLPAVVAIVLFAPARGFTAFIVIVMAWGLYEVGAMARAGTLQWLMIAVLGAGGAIELSHGRTSPWIALAAIASVIALVVSVGRRGPPAAGMDSGFQFLYSLLVVTLFPYFALLRNGAHGIAASLLVMLIVVASDSGAYFTGRSLGRVKLLPRVSPNKTVEGAIGALIASLAAGIILRPMLLPSMSIGAVAILGLAGSALAQMGDLSNSAFKRIAGVKDSGWIFPGHGGLLDRTCSLVFPVTFAYYFIYQ